jgi:mono/diheme cytochrome c family protein
MATRHRTEGFEMQKLTLTTALGALAVAGFVALSHTSAVAQAEPDPELLAALLDEGEDVYLRKAACGNAACHGPTGEGGGAPALAGNEYVRANASLIGIILGGYESHGMPAFAGRLNTREIAAVATYVRNSWGNEFGITTEAVVQQYAVPAGGD